MNPSDLLNWLQDLTQSEFSSIEDTKTGKEILLAMITISKNSDMITQIKNGSTQLEKSSNFQNVRKIFQQFEINFPFSIKKLCSGDTEELTLLLQEMYNYYNEHNRDDANVHYSDSDIDTILDKAEEELKEKYEEMLEFSKNIEDYAVARNFYLEKLLAIEEASKQYHPGDVSSITKILTVVPSDFEVDASKIAD